MKKKEPKNQWHKDKIDELKNQLSNLKWVATVLLTGYLGCVSLIYLVWYNQSEIIIKFFLLLIFIGITYLVRKYVKSTISDIRTINAKIKKNFDVLLDRKK